jgi:hypothetical protein
VFKHFPAYNTLWQGLLIGRVRRGESRARDLHRIFCNRDVRTSNSRERFVVAHLYVLIMCLRQVMRAKRCTICDRCIPTDRKTHIECTCYWIEDLLSESKKSLMHTRRLCRLSTCNKHTCQGWRQYRLLYHTLNAVKQKNCCETDRIAQRNILSIIDCMVLFCDWLTVGLFNLFIYLLNQHMTLDVNFFPIGAQTSPADLALFYIQDLIDCRGFYKCHLTATSTNCGRTFRQLVCA